MNNPHDKAESTANIYYSAFAERPKTLDPARSYNVNESLFTGNIYEPVLQYNFLKRPYVLEPLTLKQMPTVTYYDKHGNVLNENADAKQISYSIYDFRLKHGIFYQPHPAFAKDSSGNYVYHQLAAEEINNKHRIADFQQTGTRELTAADYVYQIKRLAQPKVISPIYGLMSKYIVGLADFNRKLQQKSNKGYVDLRDIPLLGAKVLGRFHYQIKIKGKYPQFKYWLAMPFFAPVPWEADKFYSQAGMENGNINFDWYPVGTGPYMLVENNPNKRMVLVKNPNFRGEPYPSQGEASDVKNGYLQDAGKVMPFIDKFIFSLERETLPRWNKFLQGYYDQSNIGSDSFDQAIKVKSDGKPELTPSMEAKHIRLKTNVSPSIFYFGFNMLDPVVGGYSKAARKLRQAISIALEQEEFINIFMNGRGISAQSPLPPDIFGYQAGKAGMNPFVYDWHNNKLQRKSIADAKKLLAQAGYPNGRSAKTGKPLVLNYDVTASSGPDDSERLDWIRKQFAKLGIQLHIRATQYNRFQTKMRTGNAQIFFWGWKADYPDPENFLFLLYGPNSKVKANGENAANYHNLEFDHLFEKMRNMQDGPKRQKLINEMIAIVQKDAPWIFGFHPIDFSLAHAWMRPLKPNALANNHLKYMRLDPRARAKSRQLWNVPKFWPIFMILGLIAFALLPVIVRYWWKEHKAGV